MLTFRLSEEVLKNISRRKKKKEGISGLRKKRITKCK